jgi:opacity protein-like surface antigen
MKRLYLLCAIIAALSAPVFSLPNFSLSAGGGGVFNIHWKSAALRDQYKDYLGGDYGHGIKAPTEQTQDAMRQGLFNTKDLTAGGGIYTFFDVTYAEAGVGLIFKNVRQTVAIPNLPDVSSTLKGEETHNFKFTQLNLSLLFKYPFTVIPQRLTIFPLLGIDGQIALGDYDDNMKKDFKKIANMGYNMPNVGEFWNSLWIQAGAGADFFFTKKLFIRGEVLYGAKLNSKYDTQMAAYWKEDISGVANGVKLRLGAGYKFPTF